jgi:membrane protease YdiL (CAAX protease family)
MEPRDWLLLAPALLVVAIIGFGLFSLLEQPILDAFFGGLPDWYTQPLPVDAVDQYSRSAWTVTLMAYFVLNVFAGPIVEELYFRGYLLPRMMRFGRWAPLLNVTLFSLYHFWAPWQFLSRIAGLTPLVYAVWWKRNIYLGMAVHVALNGIGTATISALVLSRLG